MWQAREPAEDRGGARLRRRRSTLEAADIPATRSSGSTELIERDRPHARPPVRRPARDGRPGHGRARDPRGRARTPTSSRPGRRRRARSPASRPPSRRCRPDARVVARRAGALDRAARQPGRGRAGARSSRSRSPTASTRPFAGANCARASASELGVESVLVTEDEIEDGFRFLYARAKLACEPAGAAATAALLAGKVAARAGRDRGRGRLGRQRGTRNGRCYPGRAMKADIHPEYVLATVTLLVREHVPDALDEARAARRDLLELPPVLHGQAEADGHRRPRRALPAPAREGRRRRARG